MSKSGASFWEIAPNPKLRYNRFFKLDQNLMVPKICNFLLANQVGPFQLNDIFDFNSVYLENSGIEYFHLAN